MSDYVNNLTFIIHLLSFYLLVTIILIVKYVYDYLYSGNNHIIFAITLHRKCYFSTHPNYSR